MGARSGGGGGAGFGSEFGSLPSGGFKSAPFKGAAKVGSLKSGDIVTDKAGNKYKITVAKSSKSKVVIGISSGATGNAGYDTTWMVSNKSNYIGFTKT